MGQAIIESCRVRLRPILMTSLATVIGLLPMALKLGRGQRVVCSAGAGAGWRPDRFHGVDGLSGAGRLLPCLWA